MTGRKVIMESFLNEPCGEEEMTNIALFTEGMSLFSQLFTKTFVKNVVQLDHSASDTGLFFIQEARTAGQIFADASTKLIGLLQGQADTMSKDTYYKVLFAVQADLLPAIRGVEALFSDELTLEGVVFSEAIATLLQVS